MNEITIWNYDSMAVRTIEMDGEPWFIGKDVATVLGYSNTRDALAKHVDAEDKNTVAIHDGMPLLSSVAMWRTQVMRRVYL